MIKDLLFHNSKNTSVTIAVNKGADVSLLEMFNILYYDDTKTYPSRLVELCKQIQSDYILFFHDIDILLRFDTSHFESLINWIRSEEVDRFSLGVYPSKNFTHMIEDMPIAKLGLNDCEWFVTPYDVGPSIWNVKTFMSLMEEFKNENYRTIESSGIQQRLLEKKVYGFAKKNIQVLFTLGRPFSTWFSFCHILVRGKWIPREAWQSYAPILPTLLEYFHIDQGIRGIADFYIGMNNGLSIT